MPTPEDTLIFAKDDAHAENIVEILREEFGKSNQFAQKITYRTTGVIPKDLIKSFRNSYHPRIAVMVAMIATGTDIKAVEIIKSRIFFDQMKGLGVRIMKADDLHKEVKVCGMQYQNLCSGISISVPPKRREFKCHDLLNLLRKPKPRTLS